MILELNTYKTVPGVQSADHVATVQRAHDAIVTDRPGFLHRVVGQVLGETETWADIVLWESPEHFTSVAKIIPGEPASTPWLKQIDMSHLKMRTLTFQGMVAIDPDAMSDPTIGCWSAVSWRTLPAVDPAKHQAGGEYMHREILAKCPGYRGAYMTRLTGDDHKDDWMDIVGWSDDGAALAGLESAGRTTDPAATHHIAEADPNSVHVTLVSPLIRF